MTEAQSGIFANLMKAISSKPDTMRIMADTAGQNLNPTSSNIFGGLGTSLAKSNMAKNKIASDEAGYKSMLSKVLADLTSSSDMNKVGMIRDPTTGEIKLDTQTKIPRKIDNVKLNGEKAVDASSAISQQTTQTPIKNSSGSMQDLFNLFK